MAQSVLARHEFAQRKGVNVEGLPDAPALNHKALARAPKVSLPVDSERILSDFLGFDVRGAELHAGGEAAEAARAMNAEAFTMGRHVFFGAGRFDPRSAGGLALIGHELTHVLQQASMGNADRRSVDRTAFGAMEMEARGVEEQVFAVVRDRSATIVQNYHRIYETDDGDGLSDRDLRRLDVLSKRALALAEAALSKGQAASANVRVECLDVELELELGTLPDEEIAEQWAGVIVEAIDKQVALAPPAPNVPARLPSGVDIGRDAQLVQPKLRWVFAGQNVPGTWTLVGFEGEYLIYDDGEDAEELPLAVDKKEVEIEDLPDFEQFEDFDDEIREEVKEESPTFGLPLLLEEEPFPGTMDLTETPKEEVQKFREAIGKVGDEKTLKTLFDLLLGRNAPQDSARITIVKRRARALQLDLQQFEPPEEDSYTDTEGSDSEKEEVFKKDKPKRILARRRVKKEEGWLKPNLTTERLESLQTSLKPKGQRAKKVIKPKKGSKDQKERTVEITPRMVMFEKGVRPKKEDIFRKESKFRHPSVVVSTRATLPFTVTEEQREALTKLNKMLAEGIPIEVAAKFCDVKFFIAQYRGLFYNPKTFSKPTRKQHRNLSEIDRPTFSSSVLTEGPLGSSGYYYLYNRSERLKEFEAYQKILEQEAAKIKLALLKLRSKKPSDEMIKATPRATERFKPKTQASIFTHYYSDDYDGSKESMERALKRKEREEKPKPLDELFLELPNPEIPKVSTGDVPVHAARYAYGLKPYGGHEDEVLEPGYDERGRPRHPYSGKLYVSIHPISDYGSTGPLHLVTMQNEHEINIGQVIIYERESQFEALLDKDRVKSQFKAKFPNFSKAYKSVYLEEYGLTEDLFDVFRQTLLGTAVDSDERTFVESLLSQYLAMHAELRMIEAASQEASKQGGILIYRTGTRSFGFEPPPVEKSTPKRTRKKKEGSSSNSDEEVKKRKVNPVKKEPVKEQPVKKAAVKRRPKRDLPPELDQMDIRGVPRLPELDIKPTVESSSESKELQRKKPMLVKPTKNPGLISLPKIELKRHYDVKEMLWLGTLMKMKEQGLLEKDIEIEEEVDYEERARNIVHHYGAITPIRGHDIQCYIRSLVTAAATIYHVIDADQIENFVSAIGDHLAFVNLRHRGQMIDAGGLVAAEVQRVLQVLSGQHFSPEIHIVMWNDEGLLTDFQVNHGTYPVWLYYSPGHFDLINKR